MQDVESQWAEWMRAANAGDAAAYRQVLAAIAPLLRRIVRQGFLRYGRGEADIEDVVQETLLAIHLKRQSWDAARPLVPWLRAIALNKLVDSLRRRGHRQEVTIDSILETLADEEQAPEPDLGEARPYLQNLGGKQGDILRARIVEQLDMREIARRFAMSEGAVRVALHRGIKALAAAYRSETS